MIFLTIPVDCVVTSPPYYWQRSYDVPGEIGLEAHPDQYVVAVGEVLAECRRVLRESGTLWLNIADSYNNRVAVRSSSHQPGLHHRDEFRKTWRELRAEGRARLSIKGGGLKEKDLIGIPASVVGKARDDGWFVRSEIVWVKGYGLPDGGAHDRPSRRHEMIYLLTRGSRYHFAKDGGCNTVWAMPPGQDGEHGATFPIELPTRCLDYGCPAGGVVLDPFCGVGTTGIAALRHGCSFIGIDASRNSLRRANERLEAAFAALDDGALT